ncbi:MAG TPA: formate dehydrogenase subunit gamma [Gemmatimonadales bacterium]
MIDRADWLDVINPILARLREMPGGLLPILHAIQEEVGYIPPDAVPTIAEALNLSRAEVHGVISFYHDFRSEPAGRHVVHVCRAESCQAVGAEALLAHACDRLGVEVHGTTPDGSVTVEPIYCLGNCALSPAVMVDRNLYGRVTAHQLDTMLESLRGSR